MPRAQGLLGIGYPVVTNRALIEFTSHPRHGLDRFRDLDMDRTHLEWERQQNIVMPPRKPTGPQTVYHRTSGLVPLYTGHIPGKVILLVQQAILENRASLYCCTLY